MQRPPRRHRYGVPVLSAAGDTLSVVDRAESIIDNGRAHDEGIGDRMRRLLHDHADINALLATDGPMHTRPTDAEPSKR